MASQLAEALAAVKRPDVVLKYGTAGFRDREELLDAALFRVGALAALRSREKEGVVGVMITASHNPARDNGAKIVDTNGGMLASSWEELAAVLANAADSDIEGALLSLCSEEVISKQGGTVFIGRDTRNSSSRLRDRVVEGVKAAGAETLDFGLTTTPHVHWLVREANAGREATLEAYYKQLWTNYKIIAKKEDVRNVVIDCAGGIGAVAVKSFLEQAKDLFNVEIRNPAGSDDELNSGCGAEFVQKEKKIPRSIDSQEQHVFASFDGDADRVVYFYMKEGALELLDGDKINALLVDFIQVCLSEDENLAKAFSIGVVQTAYANGSSTRYLKSIVGDENIFCVPTGVKHLHHKAEMFDIGAYFEANGHGTILFSEKVLSYSGPKTNAAERLLALASILNQGTGDALADLVATEAVLSATSKNVHEWSDLYTDVPSRQMKVAVADRSAVLTNSDETRVIDPQIVQDEIDKKVGAVRQGRAFVRPSGTENVVRVYAEAETQGEADSLANEVASVVFHHLAGVGECPRV
uniref:Phosphoacetylglucosamine mutase n=1 Tax=Palpitomonas bilix TaxID=652834 RepID=A0A7S3DEW7_9EUKA